MQVSKPLHIARQFTIFTSVGVFAAAIHYAVLIGLVESQVTDPVKANLVAYISGGVVSYLLNRRWAFRSDRVHAEAVWRFAVVAGVGFLLTGILTYLFHERMGIPYIVAAMMTSAVVVWWHFIINKIWTFREAR